MMKRAKGRLRFMKRKAGEVAGNLKKKAATAAVNVAFAGDAAKEKVKSTAATVKKRVTDAPKVAKRSLKDRIKKGALAVAKRMSEETVEEKFGMAADPSKPQSPRPTKMPKSRERNIGKHDDYKDNPNRDFGVRPEKGQKLRSRASAVVQSQRRTDKEVGVREQSELDEAKKKMPYVKMFRKAGNLGRDGSPEAMERSKKITGVMNKNAARVAAHRERDDAAKDAKAARKAKMKEELSVDDQMKISQAYNRMSPEEKKAANKKAMGNVKKVAAKVDTRTDAQKMTDAVGKPRMGSSD